MEGREGTDALWLTEDAGRLRWMVSASTQLGESEPGPCRNQSMVARRFATDTRNCNLSVVITDVYVFMCLCVCVSIWGGGGGWWKGVGGWESWGGGGVDEGGWAGGGEVGYGGGIEVDDICTMYIDARITTCVCAAVDTLS